MCICRPGQIHQLIDLLHKLDRQAVFLMEIFPPLSRTCCFGVALG